LPEPILVAAAAALAAKAAGNLYDLVKRKFTGNKEAIAALDAAEGAAPDSPEVHALADQLANAAATDPEFSAAPHASASSGGVVNQVSGTVQGNLPLTSGEKI
jgi:hypothetical protein